MEKNSDKSHGSTGMFPHQFGRFLPLVGHLPSEKSILLDFSSSRVAAILDCESHSQEWRHPWGWKNLRELNFHWEDGSLGAKNAQIGEETCQLSRGTCQNFVSFTFVAVGATFLKVIFLGQRM